MSKLTMFGLVIGSIILKITLFRLIKIGGWKPDILLIIIVFLAFYNGSYTGAIFGFIGGLTEDIFGSGFLGLYATSKSLIGFVFGLAGKQIYKAQIYPYILGTLIATLIQEFFVFFWHKIFQPYTSFFINSFKQIILPLVIYNSLLSPLVILSIKKILKIEKHKQ